MELESIIASNYSPFSEFVVILWKAHGNMRLAGKIGVLAIKHVYCIGMSLTLSDGRQLLTYLSTNTRIYHKGNYSTTFYTYIESKKKQKWNDRRKDSTNSTRKC